MSIAARETGTMSYVRLNNRTQGTIPHQHLHIQAFIVSLTRCPR